MQTKVYSVINVCGDWLFISLHLARCLYLSHVWAGAMCLTWRNKHGADMPSFFSCCVDGLLTADDAAVEFSSTHRWHYSRKHYQSFRSYYPAMSQFHWKVYFVVSAIWTDRNSLFPFRKTTFFLHQIQIHPLRISTTKVSWNYDQNLNSDALRAYVHWILR